MYACMKKNHRLIGMLGIFKHEIRYIHYNDNILRSVSDTHSGAVRNKEDDPEVDEDETHFLSLSHEICVIPLPPPPPPYV